MKYNLRRALKKFNKSVVSDVISIDGEIYDVVERLIESEGAPQLPIIVERHNESAGLQIFEQVEKKLSEQVFDSVQRLEDNVFYVEYENCKNVYIVDEYNENYFSTNGYDKLVNQTGAFNELLKCSAYNKHLAQNLPNKQPGSEQ